MALTGILAGCALGGCGSSVGNQSSDASPDSGPQKVGQMVELASWWQAPGEAEAIAALIRTFQNANPGYKVDFDLVPDGPTMSVRLPAQLANPQDDIPPDVAQYNSYNVRPLLAQVPDSLTVLDGPFADASLTAANVPEEVLDAIAVDGHVYSIPLDIHRENMLFYNLALLTANNITPPTTIDELITDCLKLKAAGVVPVLTSYVGWIQRIMFNAVVAGTLGAAKFRDFMSGQIPFTDTAWSEAVDKYAAVLEACVDDATARQTESWTACSDDLYRGRGAFFFHGDWAKGYLVSRGATPGTDFGGMGSPGARDLFWFGVDVLILPKSSANPAGAALFFKIATSIEGQLAFNRLKGSTPFRTDVPASSLDPVGAQTQADFKAANAIRMLVVDIGAWDTALGDFAINRDRAALLQAYVANPVVRQ